MSDYELIPQYPNLTTIPGPTFNPVVWTKQLRIPGAIGAYNPSLITYGDGYLLSARFDVGNAGAPPFSGENSLEDQMVFVKLNRDFEVHGRVSRASFSGGGPHSSGQDPRLFWWNNKVWVVFNARNEALTGTPRRMVLAELKEKEGVFSLGAGKFLSYSNDPFEKNWVPFVVKNELYFVFNTEPHTVIKPDLDTGVCSLVAMTSAFPWQRGHLRGGTPALPYGDQELISIFHSSKRYRYLNNVWRQVYVIGAYTFSADKPFAVTRYTPLPIEGEGYYDEGNNWKIIFAAGLVIEGKYAYIAMGRNDTQILISKVSMEQIEKSLLPFHGELVGEKNK